MRSGPDRTENRNALDGLSQGLDPWPGRCSRFRLHGLDLEVTSDSARILEAVSELLAPFAVSSNGAAPNPLRFHFRHGPCPDAALVEKIRRGGRLIFDSSRHSAIRDAWDQHFRLQYYAAGGLHLADYGQLGLVVTDPAAGRTLGFITDPDAVAPYVLSNFVFFLSLYETLRYRDRFFIHAAGLEHRGRGILLPGLSGSGKSTLTVALLRAGFAFLSDDRLILERRPGGIQTLAFPEKIDVTARTLWFFDELAALRDGTPGAGGRSKKSFAMEAFFSAPTVTHCRPAVILFPAVASEAAASRIEPMAPSEAATLLLPQGLLVFDPATAHRHFQLLCDLVEQCACYRLHFARDFDSVPALVEALL